MPSERLATIGRWCFLAGVFLMVTGDGLTNIHKPVAADAWPWLYLAPFAASFVCMALAGRIGPRRPARAAVVYAPLAALLAALAISAAFSQIKALSVLALGCAAGIAVFWWFAAQLVEDDRLAEATWIAAALAIFVLAMHVIMWRLAETIDHIPVQIRTVAWLGKLQIAWVLNLFAPFLFARFIGDRRRLLALFSGVVWVAAGAAIYLLFSRMGSLVFLVTAAVICLVNLPHWRRWAPLVVAGTAAAVVIGVNSPDTTRYVAESFFDKAQNPGIDLRLRVWTEAWSMFTSNPVTGIGVGTFDEVTYRVAGTRANTDFRMNGWHAHNALLHVMTEAGILGLAAWVWLWVTVLGVLAKAWKRGDVQQRLYGSAALVSVLAFQFLSMTEVLIGARVEASLRMNLTIGLLVVAGLRMAMPAPSTVPGSLRPQSPGSYPELAGRP